MDFRQTPQSNNSRPAATPLVPDAPEQREEKARVARTKSPAWLQMFNGIMLVGVAILVAGISIALARSQNSTVNSENKYVSSGKYQAVFLNGGQIYFGSITNMNNNYVRLTNVYYLTQSTTDTANSNYSLVKLGCQQIHDPYDAMIINRAQISFWENLQDDGKVVTSIKKFIKQNPNGPDCSKVSTQTQAATSTTTQGAADTTKK